MDKLNKCPRGESCPTCRDLTPEDLRRLKEQFESEQLELVIAEKPKK